MIGVLILFVVAALVISPLVTIWSLNALFGLGIPHTIWTYLAALWLSAIVYGGSATSRKS